MKFKFAPTFYAGFLVVALGGLVAWAAGDDPNQALKVSLWGKNATAADTRIAVDAAGAVKITDGAGALNVIVDSLPTVTITDGAGAVNVIVDSLPTVTVTDGAGALNTIVDSGTLTAVTTITNPVTVTDGSGALNVIVDSLPAVTVTDGAGALNTIVDSGTLTAVTTITNPVTVTDGSGSLNTIVDSGTLTTVTNLTGGTLAHDAPASAANPVLTGCYANAAAPADVTTDVDSVREWCLKNGARAAVLTAAGALIGGDAANGLDVDVTRLPALVAGSAIVGKVGIDQTTPGTTNLVQITDGSGALNVIIDSSATLTVNSHAVTVASGGIASGAVASGAYASGAYASGSIGSGAIASGAVASGAVASGAYASGSISAGAIAAGASSLVKTEDTLSADQDAGVPAMCTRKATAANVSGTDGDYEFLQCSAGRLWVSSVLEAGSAIVGKVGVDQTTPGTTNAVQAIPGINTGLSMYNLEPTAGDNHIVVKAGAGNVYHIAIFTKHTAAQYFRLYDATTGFNGCNSATNLKWSGIVPAASTGAGYVQDIAMGLTFATGISICLTGAYGQTDTTAATASVTELNIGYK